MPKPEIERTPWQQLWIEWVGLEPLSYHLADWPDHVEKTLDLLEQRARTDLRDRGPFAGPVRCYRRQHHGISDRAGALSQVLRAAV